MSTTTQQAPSMASGRGGSGSRKLNTVHRKERRAGLLFAAPFAILFVLIFLVPLGYAFYISLFREQLVGGKAFVGLGNYSTAFGDAAFRSGVLRVLRYGLIQVPVMLIVALLFALALDSGKLWWSKLFRIGIFLPFAVPSVVAALMWGYLYGKTFGPFPTIMHSIGLSSPAFLSSGWMLSSLANVAVWEWCGYNAIIMYAALRSVSPDLYEAAAIDGAGAIQIAWRIKIPSIAPALFLTLVFSVIGTLQLFNEPQIFSVLAPDVLGTTYTPNLYAYTLAFTNQQYGLSAAISFTLGLVIFVASYGVIILSARRSQTS